MAHSQRGARLVAGLMAIAIAGCGSAKTSAGSGRVPIDPAFIAKVTAVCTKDNAISSPKGKFPYPQFNPYRPQADLLPKVATYFKTDSTNALVPGQLATLGEPAQDAAQWDQLRTLVDENVANSDKQIAAAEASDRTTFIATLGPAQGLNNQMLAEARQAGFAKHSPCNMALF
jgi:hypothetical protein